MNNSRGNISFSLMVLVFVILLVLLLTAMFSNNLSIVLKTQPVVEELIQRDSAVAWLKYETINYITSKEFTSFDETTSLITTQDISTLNNQINSQLTEQGYKFSVTDLAVNNVLISDYCDNLFGINGGGEEEFLGVFCNYVPFNLDVTLTLDGLGEIVLELSNIYFYVEEETDKVLLDTANYQIKLKGG